MASKVLNKSLKNKGKNVLHRICTLKPVFTDMPEINLEPGTNIIGRSKINAIKEGTCSKRQLEMDVDMEESRIKVRVIGVNPSGVNGFMAMKDTKFETNHGDILEVVYGKLFYEVIFKPPPDGNNHQNQTQNSNYEEPTTSCGSWDSVEDGKMLIFTSSGVRPSELIASYDMDGTIIKTKSGNVFPKNCDDWELNYTKIPEKLKQLNSVGFKIVIFTNQSGIQKGKVSQNEFKRKIEQVIKKLGVPVQAFIAIANDYNRKPRPGMWDYLRDHKNNTIKLNLNRCFYVGDAAGRPEFGSGVNKRKKDHSLADRLFAFNVGVSFYTPEEHFLNGKTLEWNRLEYNPTENMNNSLFIPPDTKLTVDDCEMIIMVGLPGSGKSHFVHDHLSNKQYVVANADTMGNVRACLKACEEALTSGKSCVVDNTNVDIESRKKFIELAQKKNVSCRCFMMNTSMGQIKHNIVFRELTDKKHSKINDMVFNTLKKKYQDPTKKEGFTDIVLVNIHPKFESETHAKLYKLYLVEK